MKVRAWPTIAIALFGILSASCDHPGHTGNVSLHVTVASEVLVPAVDYEVSRLGEIALKGGIDADVPASSFTRFISHVPVGTDYQLKVTAKSSDGKQVCDGATKLDVRVNTTTQVNLGIGCRNAGDGMVVISVGVTCPAFQLTSLTVSPLAVSVGGAIAVEAAASDLDAGSTSYRWTAPVGTFAKPTDARTTYQCTAPGPAALTVTAANGPCRADQSVTVQCVSDGGVEDARKAD